jgi:hypothetical protein
MIMVFKSYPARLSTLFVNHGARLEQPANMVSVFGMFWHHLACFSII